MTTAIIGDVHGRPDLLRNALAYALNSADQVVLVGDYVNRGPDSRNVITELILVKARLAERVRLLRGNHDQVLLDFLDSGDPSVLISHGGLATIKSYGPFDSLDPISQFRVSFPRTHRAFLEQLEDYYETPEFFVSHSGLNPVSMLSRTRDDVALGSHPELFDHTSHTDWPKLVVSGHYAQSSGQPFISENFICVDTGCGLDPCAPLTCLSVPQLSFQQFRSPSHG